MGQVSGVPSFSPTLVELQASDKVTVHGQLRNNAFVNDTTLTKVVLPDGVISIEGGAGVGGSFPGAFYGSSKLTEVVLPSTLVAIGRHAFYECNSLRVVAFPPSLRFMASDAFVRCTNLHTDIPTMPVWAPTLGELRAAAKVNVQGQLHNNAFSNDTTLTKVVLPDGVTSIEGGNCRYGLKMYSAGAFYGCSSLVEIVLPDTLVAIGENTFCNCCSLQGVALPDALAALGRHAFYGCPDVKITWAPSLAALQALGKVNGAGQLRNDAFSGDTTLTKVVLPDGVTSIEGGQAGGEMPNQDEDGGAFNGCTSLSAVVLPDTLTGAIGRCAFYECSSLSKVELPARCVEIGVAAFGRCRSLTAVALPSALLVIDNAAFNGCSSLEEVSLPSTLVTIGESAFRGCSSLREIELPDTLMAATSENAFHECSLLTTLYITALPTTDGAATVAKPHWSTILSAHLPRVARVSAPDAIVAVLGGPFNGYFKYTDLPPVLQAAPSRIRSLAGVGLWRWWTPPDVACGGPRHQFHRLSTNYRATVWTMLLVGERYAALVGTGVCVGRSMIAVVPYGSVPVELWMLVFGFVRRDVPVRHTLANHRTEARVWLFDEKGRMHVRYR
jgi:hypothetical protein